jgi:hypothetical protein
MDLLLGNGSIGRVGTARMSPRKCAFGQLNNDDAFVYKDQLYRKDSELSAILVRWSTGVEASEERVIHRFFPEIVVELPDEEGHAGQGTASQDG